MDRNQKAALIALMVVVVLAFAAIGIIVYAVRTESFPTISLPQAGFSGRERPAETFNPKEVPSPEIPPQAGTPAASRPPAATTSNPAPTDSPSVSYAPTAPPIEQTYKSVFFGSYEQGKGKEPIEWFVLEEGEDNCLLISRYALDILRFHGSMEPVTWETCGLRAWLNSVFIDIAFNEKEREAVLVTEVDNSVGNQIFNIDGGNNTEDRVYLLSREEVGKYFPTEGERICRPTAATKSTAVAGYTSWWLRTPGAKETYAEYINFNGAFLDGSVNRQFTAIRPVVHVALKSLQG